MQIAVHWIGFDLSAGDYSFGDNESWVDTWKYVKHMATVVIAISIACVGLSTNLKKLTKLGYKPFICGLIASLSVGLVSFLLVTIFSSRLKF